MCVPVRGHRGELGDRRSRRVDLEASRDAAGPERPPGSREAVRRASSRSDNSLTEQSASDRSPAHAGPSTARGRPRSEASFEKVIRTSTLSTIAASHRTQRGGRESNSSWRGRDPPKTSQLELVTALEVPRVHVVDTKNAQPALPRASRGRPQHRARAARPANFARGRGGAGVPPAQRPSSRVVRGGVLRPQPRADVRERPRTRRARGHASPPPALLADLADIMGFSG